MTKKEFINIGYKQLVSNDIESVDTLYKQFENGRTFIVQFNEEVKNEPIGIVYITKDQLIQLI